MNKSLFAMAAFLAASTVWASQTMRADDARVVVMGRTDAQADGAVRFAYPGVRFALLFTGQAMAFQAVSSGDESYIEVSLDDGPARLVRLTRKAQTITLDNDTPARMRKVEILHRSETWHGVVTVSDFHTDGEFRSGPALPARRMLVLGDSVTCGEALERVAGAKKDHSWWNARQSYGMLAAQALGAQVHLVCHGGRGLVRSWDGRTDEANLADFYELAIADAGAARWDHRRYQPDLILSAIGTNDFGPGVPARGPYVAAYVSFVKTLLRNHPRAKIVLTEGAILKGEHKRILAAYIDETIKQVDSERLSHVVSNHYPGAPGDDHPTRDQHAAMARDLAPRLRAVAGW